MTNLNSTDWLILLLYLFCVLAIGFSLRLKIKTGTDFFQAGRALPAWVCAVALVAASLGIEEVIAMGAAGAWYGFKAALFFSLGAIPAMVFAGIYMMPLYYGSGARTVPEYVGLRFDEKTRLLNACTFLAMTLTSAGISLFVMGRIFQALHVFDSLFFAYGVPRQGIFTFGVLFGAAVVLVYLLFAGLAGAIVNQVLQFLLIIAGLLPVVLMGLKNIGGWDGLKAAVPAAFGQSAFVMRPVPAAIVWLMLGFVLSGGRWCSDFRLLQNAMAAKNIETARRIPLLAAAMRLVLPFLLILPGAIAIGLPTPQSTTVVRNENGVIYHEITVVPREAAEGHGLVPARVDAVTGTPLLDAKGQTRLNYDRATPAMLMHFFPTGLLGLGLTVLLASLMSGLAASMMAFSSVLTHDIYETCIRKGGGDRHAINVGRGAVLGGALLSIAAAHVISGFYRTSFTNSLEALLLVFSVAIAPQLATILMGMFTKRATGNGAFAGFAAGTAAAVLHYGLTLPADASAGLYGGWIAVVHRYPGFVAQCFWTTIVGFAVNVMVAAAVSFGSKARTDKELMGLVYWLRARRKAGA